MKQEELSALQAPLKQKYQQDPEGAVITLRAEGDLGEGIACKVDTGHALIEAGLHPATGGDGSQACSGDMLLEALAACAGVTLRAVATAFGVDLRKGKVIAEGDLDFRGTLGVTKETPVGFKEIRLKFETESDVDEATMNKVIAVTERYCVVLQTIRNAPPVSVSVTAMN
ncbi:putative OsmC-like protein [Natronocella acetinitrilica]|uniref:OsmC-like protein n=1 Tax=Natronocella acetinitrilica TaxID=414046 RepID=A0AAE3G981_9GAMM|nr:OsmC family protein [Natronocella acetinitrilica]MCP1677171.1 putative OsmC-like protein [Natronocella acetinitrilica]